MLESDVGDVRIIGTSERTEVHAIVELVGLGSSDAEALERLSEMDAELVREGDALVGRLVYPEHSGSTRYVGRWSIEVPAGTLIDLRTDVGDVLVAGEVGDVNIRADVGDVFVDAPGNVRVRSDVGDVTVRGAGVLDVVSDVGDVSVFSRSFAGGAQLVKSDVGDIYVVLPSSFRGVVRASCDVGDTSINLGNGRHASGDGSVTLALGDENDGTFTAASDVGDVTVVAGDDHGAMGSEPDLNVPKRTEAVGERERTAGAEGDHAEH